MSDFSGEMCRMDTVTVSIAETKYCLTGIFCTLAAGGGGGGGGGKTEQGEEVEEWRNEGGG